MSIIIDGYNLISAVGILGRGVGPGGLERSRLAILNFLAESLDRKEIAKTTIVFDARDALPGLPRTVDHRGLTVRFATHYEDADALVEELIRANSAPRRLTVVSSDHRLQRAARRRRARAVDSDVWYAEVVQQRAQRLRVQDTGPARPPVPLLQEDVEYWVRQFGGQSALNALTEEGTAGSENRPQQTDPAPRETQEPVDDKPTSEIENPFPPGYGEDLLEDHTSDRPDPWLPPGGKPDREDG